ncbi:hypothetical protein V6C27_05530 [Peptococcaceae bacterium 1198_IL3148]
MDAWLNLIKKEFRMTRASLLVTLGALIIIGLWLMYLSQKHSVAVILAPVVLSLWVAAFLPAGFMLYSVDQELKHTPNLWLHCPQPAWMLISAKLIVSIMATALLLLIEAAFIYWALFSIDNLTPAGVDKQTAFMFITEVGAYVALGVIAISIYMSSWATLIAVATATARNILGRLKWLAGIAVFIIATWGMAKFQESILFQMLTEWGAFTIPIRTLGQLMPAEAHLFNGVPIYTGQIVFAVVVTIAVYALSAWLLDNKVEV